MAAGVDGLIVVDLPPEEDDELCLPARAGGPRLHPPRHADHRRPAAAGGARATRRLRLLRLDHRHHRHPLGRCRRGARRGRAASSGTPICRSRSASASGPPAQAAAIARAADAAVVGSALVDARSRPRRPRAAPRPGPSSAVTILSPGLPRASAPLASMAAYRKETAVNWINNVVRPKIRSLLNKREMPKTCG